MARKLIFLLCSLITFTSYSLAANEFSITTESDSKDYIGWGKWWSFSSSNKDKLTITNADTKNAQLSVESFSLWTPMNFIFWVKDGKALIQGLYDPAKRHPFRWSYNGIEVYWDGRWCNTIVGKFYVHEYSVSSNGIVDKAAIDFVQYCEWWTAWLYGSLRYNSSIVSSCTKAWSCEWVKKVLNISSSTSTNTTNSNQPSSTDIRSLQKMYKKHYKTFTSFMQWEYNMTYRKDFKNVNKYCKVNKLFDIDKNSPDLFTNSSCGITYNDIIQEFNAWFAAWWEEWWDLNFDRESILSLRKTIVDTQNEKKTKLTMKEDMMISIGILWMIRVDYIIHDMLFSI